MLEFSTTSTPTAQKEYRCDLCNGKIQVGEKYERFTGKYDGDMFDIKHHLICSEIIRQYCEYIGENEYDSESAYEWAEEVVCRACEHGDEEREDYTPCCTSLHSCKKVMKYFEKEVQGG